MIFKEICLILFKHLSVLYICKEYKRNTFTHCPQAQGNSYVSVSHSQSTLGGKIQLKMCDVFSTEEQLIALPALTWGLSFPGMQSKHFLFASKIRTASKQSFEKNIRMLIFTAHNPLLSSALSLYLLILFFLSMTTV